MTDQQFVKAVKRHNFVPDRPKTVEPAWMKEARDTRVVITSTTGKEVTA